MYKLSEVAKKLKVEKVLLFEMLLTKGEYLDKHIKKEHGVTYLSDKGIEIMGKIISGQEIEIVKEDEIEKSEDKSDIIALEEESNNIDLHTNTYTPSEENMSLEEDNTKDNFLSNKKNQEKSESKISEFTNLAPIDKEDRENTLPLEDKAINSISDIFKASPRPIKSEENDKVSEVKKLEILTAKSKFSKFEKEEKRNKISNLRNEFIALDSEIRKKQEALESYDKILEEDIKWICILEDKLSAKIKEKLSETENNNQLNLVDKMFFRK